MFKSVYNKERFYNIDAVRLLVVIMIVYYHIIRSSYVRQFADVNIYQYLANNAAYAGFTGNAFLFMVSGYFLYFSILKCRESFLHFSLKKALRFWPTLCFAVLVTAILSLFGLIKFDIGQNILNLLFITKGSTGLTTRYTNLNVSWFVCSLFWSGLFYYAIFRLIKDQFTRNFVISLISYFGLVIYMNSSVRDSQVIFGFLIKGGTLAISLIGVGILFGNFLSEININTVNLQPITATILEIICIVYIVNGCIFNKFQETLLVPLLVSLTFFGLLILKRGWISSFLNHTYFSQIGKYAFSIYIMQDTCFVGIRYLWLNILGGAVKDCPIIMIIISISICVCIGVITYHLIEKPLANYCKQKLERE